MAEIWYLVTSVIQVYHIVGSVFGPVRFLLPVCRLSWLLYTFNIYAHFSLHFSQQLFSIDDRNLIFGHKLHIGTPYRGKCFWTHQIPTSCSPIVDFYTHWTYMLIFRGIFLSNYWWQKSDISSQASYRYPILWEVFLTHQIPTSCLPT